MDIERTYRLLYSAFLVLFAQAIISVVLFSRTIPDGGKWPLILAITIVINIFYATFVLWLVQIQLSTPAYTGVATLGLAACIFSLNNFGWGSMSGDGTFYALYAVFILIPLLVKLARRR